MLTVLIVTLFFVGGIALIVWYLKSFYAERDNRAKKAEEHRSKHGGECILSGTETLPMVRRMQSLEN